MKPRVRFGITLISILILSSLVLSACSATSQAALVEQAQTQIEEGVSEEQAAEILRQVASLIESQEITPADVANLAQQAANLADPQLAAGQEPKTAPDAPAISGDSDDVIAAYQGVLQQVYETVSPSVVNIHVLVKNDAAAMGSEMPFEIPGMPGIPDGQMPEAQPYSQGLGSGFVWDKQGYIVTNNHVAGDADKIEVTFSDGASVPAELVGTDPDSDLAVIKVDLPADYLQPVELGDSKQLKVGQLAIAIGNPYGLEGTMTVGIISALGRTLPADMGLSGAPSYSIPDVIQTDAPINPGNSGGVLVNDRSQVIGVTFAIESPSGANSGIGFVIPAAIVGRVVPSLIENGSYQHPYLGIRGGSLNPAVAEAMGLEASQRGVLVGEVTPGGPADQAGLRGSSKTAEIDGQEVNLGGDVITAIDNTPIKDMDDLIAYLSNNTQVGQAVSLDLLRGGKNTQVEVELAARPEQAQVAEMPEAPTAPEAPTQPGKAWLGIDAATLEPASAQSLGLDSDQQGVLVQGVGENTPAEESGLLQGDVIIAIDGSQIATIESLIAVLAQYQPGDEITLTLLRNGQELEINLVLGARPS